RALLRVGDGTHVEAEVRALGAGVEHFELDAELLAEVLDDLLLHVALGGCREAGDLRDLEPFAAAELPDEPRGVEVVGPEVVAPLRQAVRLVEDPALDLALPDDLAERLVAELLRRDVEERDLAVGDAV